MAVGLLLVDCFIPQSQSLKDKRRVLSSVTERLRRNHNIAICEVESQDQWQRSRLAIVTVNTQWPMAEHQLQRITEFLEENRDLEVLDCELQRLT
jgi:uncharacterized protein